MLTSGDVIRVGLGTHVGSEAGMVRPAVIVTAQRVLEHSPRVLQVVPLTRALRGWTSEVVIPADAGTGIAANSAAQCQHLRAISIDRVVEGVDEPGNVGALVLHQIRETLATLLDLLLNRYPCAGARVTEFRAHGPGPAGPSSSERRSSP
jgi:mRNA interferase MazF